MAYNQIEQNRAINHGFISIFRVIAAYATFSFMIKRNNTFPVKFAGLVFTALQVPGIYNQVRQTLHHQTAVNNHPFMVKAHQKIKRLPKMPSARSITKESFKKLGVKM